MMSIARSVFRPAPKLAALAATLTVASATTLFAATMILAWPGVAVYDTVAQYQQALAGAYDDWHPPIMAWIWHGMLSLGWRGAGAMLALQLALYWGGLGALAWRLFARGARGAAVAMLAIGLFPIVLNWMVVVEKDAQLVAALVAASGLAALGLDMPDGEGPDGEGRDGKARDGRAGWARWFLLPAIALLLVYAALVRSNAIFIVAPLALGWAGWLGVRHPLARLALLGLVTLVGIGAGDVVNHRLLGAARSEVQRTLPLFDLAGIAHRAPLATIPRVDPASWAHAERIGCYTPFYWDPFGDADRCGRIGDRLVAPGTVSPIFHEWIGAIATHPLAYAGHRLAHLNATLRVYAPANEPSANAPGWSEPNDVGLATPAGTNVQRLAKAANILAATPLGAPVLWLVAAIGLCWIWMGTPCAAMRRLGLSLSLSAVCLEASFTLVSIASDLRYHLWVMVAPLMSGLLLFAAPSVPRDRVRVVIISVVIVALSSLALRMVAPQIPR